MMAYTDLGILKHLVKTESLRTLVPDLVDPLQALIDRLEAAERVCECYINSLHPAQGTPAVIKDWLKASGKQAK